MHFFLHRLRPPLRCFIFHDLFYVFLNMTLLNSSKLSRLPPSKDTHHNQIVFTCTWYCELILRYTECNPSSETPLNSQTIVFHCAELANQSITQIQLVHWNVDKMEGCIVGCFSAKIVQSGAVKDKGLGIKLIL